MEEEGKQIKTVQDHIGIANSNGACVQLVVCPIFLEQILVAYAYLNILGTAW